MTESRPPSQTAVTPQSHSIRHEPLISLTKPNTHDPSTGRGRGQGKAGSDPPQNWRFADPAGVPPSHPPRRVAPLRIFLGRKANAVPDPDRTWTPMRRTSTETVSAGVAVDRWAADMMDESRITKIEAAQRQINAGIRMLFRNDDPVAVHTVAMAGFRILRDLVKHKGLEHPIDSLIRPGKENELWRGASSFANFFKHANTDPDGVSDGFSEEINESVLLIAATYYGLLGCEQTDEMQTLTAWYMAVHPDILAQDANPAIQVLVLASGEIRSLERAQQLKIGSTVLERWSEAREAARN